MARTLADRRALVSIALVCAAVCFAAIPAMAAAPIILRAGASDPEGTTAPALSIGKLCELATKLSNGELNAQPFYQSLGVEQQLAAAVKAGSVDIGFTAVSNLARFTDAFLQFDLPFLFRNDKDYIEVLKNHPAGKKAIAQFEKDLGVKVLLITSHTYDGEVSGTNLETRNKPVKVPADIKGLKLRTASTPVEIALIKAYGANPTPVDYGQLYSALQQGVVDGNAATPLPPSVSIKLYEVTKYYVATGFRYNLLPIYINQKKFDSLTPFQQKALTDAAAQTEALAGQYARDKVKSSIETLEKAGVHIYHPNKEEMAQWLSVREKVWQTVAEEFKGKVDLNVANEIYKMNPR
ncbi:MAG TPA: TRAP transporter substrate-binding protein [Candidatus Methylomirabilis sp.]|nr:TRAP transporter substrate-binding protein [Candidatus Methylomirabilis sp.]HSC72163.1 TRAP transporter substrate-binding protein [Candidatus Methylomirabilis sp.]